MNSKKITNRISLGIIACLSLLLFTSAIGKFEAYFRSNTEVMDSRHPGFELLDNDLPQVTWNNSNQNEIGNAYIRKELTDSYIKAWKWLFACVNNDDFRGMDDYFHTEIKDKLIQSFSNQDANLKNVDLEHNLELLHLSDDYSVAVLKDKNVRLLTHVLTDKGENAISENYYDFEVNMVLRDGKWKIFNWKSTASDMVHVSVEAQGDLLVENLKKIKAIKGINYYPASSPWTSFWADYNTDTLAKDFNLIKEMGFNTIRVFISLEAFGRNKIDQTAIRKLDDLLCIAEESELSVIPTLFDFPIGFDLNTYPSYLRQVKYLSTRYAENATIIAWDIKNEPDQDFAIHGQYKVLSWLKTITSEFKKYNNNHPITIGWADADYSTLLSEDVDFISFHHYKDIQDLKNAYAQIEDLGKPILLEEFGYSSSSSIWNLFQNSEKKQEAYLKEVLEFIKLNDIPWMIWTLYDFENAPSEVFGNKPWIKDSQKHFGLINSDGSLKLIGNEILNFNKINN